MVRRWAWWTAVGGGVADRFELLATDVDGRLDPAAWDRGEELRVYALAPIPPDAFERIVDALTTAGQPRWPVWLIGDPDGREGIPSIWQEDVDAALIHAWHPELVIASPGLLQPVAAAKEWPSLGAVEMRNWFAYLGLDKTPR